MNIKYVLAIIAILYARPTLTAYMATLATIGAVFWTYR